VCARRKSEYMMNSVGEGTRLSRYRCGDEGHRKRSGDEQKTLSRCNYRTSIPSPLADGVPGRPPTLEDGRDEEGSDPELLERSPPTVR